MSAWVSSDWTSDSDGGIAARQGTTILGTLQGRLAWAGLRRAPAAHRAEHGGLLALPDETPLCHSAIRCRMLGGDGVGWSDVRDRGSRHSLSER